MNPSLSLISVCAKFPLRSMSRSGLKVCGNGGGFQVSTVSNLNPIYIELVLGLGFDNIVPDIH